MNTLKFEDKFYQLQRFPLYNSDPLKAWNAADEYLLNYCTEQQSNSPIDSLLLVNDNFGALALALHQHNPVCWGDSYLGHQALVHNLDLNGLPTDNLNFVPADQVPETTFDLVLINLPKSLNYLEDILRKLRPLLKPGARVVVGGMIKHTPAKAYKLLGDIIGPTKTSLGVKKARLAIAEMDIDLVPAEMEPMVSYQLPDYNFSLSNAPNVFSRERLDSGTRLLLSTLVGSSETLKIVDLGCGNGVLSLVLASIFPNSHVMGVDESYQAVSCSKQNAQNANLDPAKVSFFVGDCLVDMPVESLDLVVCNPPFHQGQVVGDNIAWHMFQQAHRALKKGGELLVVGNRHMGYHIKLQRLFGSTHVVDSDNKFVILCAIK